MQFAAEGKDEKAKEMAIKMLAAGEAIKKIVAYTGLKKAVVAKLLAPAKGGGPKVGK